MRGWFKQGSLSISRIVVDQLVEPATVNIARVHIHPHYRKGSSYNNIAILKLSSLLDFANRISPTCIWIEQKWPFRDASVLGTGRRDLVQAVYPDGDFELGKLFVLLSVIVLVNTS